MKKVTSLALIVSLLMMTMIIAPVSVSAVSALPITDNFNGDTIDTTKWDKVSNSNQSPGASIIDGSTYGVTGNVLKLDGVDFNNFGIKTTNCIPSAFVVKFDVYLADNYANSELKLKGGSNDEFLYIKKDIITYTSNAGRINIPITTGKWYNVKFTIDTTTKATSTTVTPAGGTPTTVSGTFGTINPANEIYFQGLYMNTNSTFALVDNVSIEEYVAPAHELPITDDFSGSAIDPDKWNVNNGTASQVSLSNGALKIYDIYANAGIGVKLDKPVTTGKVNIKYDVWVDTNFIEKTSARSELIVYGGDGFKDACSLLYMSKDGFVGYKTHIHNLVAETWYSVDMTLDVATQNIEVVVTPKDEGASVSKTVASQNTALASNTQFSFGAKNLNYSPKSYALIDNVSITQDASAPKAEGLTFKKYDNTTSAALTNVPAGTKELVVKFNSAVEKSTLSDDTVTLVNKKTGAKVEYTGVYDADAKTWTIPVGAAYLDASTNYELTITPGVANSNGEKASLFRYAFTTDAGEFKADLAVYKGDTRITKLSELSDGDVVTVKAEVVNTTGKDQNLLMLYAGYNTNKVTQSQVFNKTIKATDKNITAEEFTVTVDKTNLTHIKFFGWSNYQPVKSITVSDNIIQ